MEFKIISYDIGQIPTWIGALATVAAVLVALFGDIFKKWIFKPVLRATITDGPPDNVIIKKESGYYSYISRLWIENKGKSTAKNVEVYVKNVKKKNDHGIFIDDESWQPMNLKWSNIGGIYLENLHVGMGKHCDFTEIFNRHHWFVFCSIDPPNNGGHEKNIGEYMVEVLVASTNHGKPISVLIEANFEKFEYSGLDNYYDKTPHENKVPVKMRIVDKRLY
jgi:hypothetical protein